MGTYSINGPAADIVSIIEAAKGAKSITIEAPGLTNSTYSNPGTWKVDITYVGEPPATIRVGPGGGGGGSWPNTSVTF